MAQPPRGRAVVVPIVVAVLVGIAAIAFADDLFRRMRAAGARPVPLVALLGVVALVAVAAARGEDAPGLFPFVIGGALAVGFVTAVLRAHVGGAFSSLMTSAFAVVYAGMLPAYIVVLARMPAGSRLVLAFALLAAASGAAAAAVRSRRRGRALAPTLTASVTWEDSAVAAVAAVAVAAILGAVLDAPLAMARLLVLAGVVAVAMPVGALAGAMIARDIPMEPSRLAAFVAHLRGPFFAAPLFFYAWRVLIR